MARQKGTTKTGGRQRGTPNKLTATTRQWVAGLLENNRAAFAECLKMLQPTEFAKVYLTLLSYEIPKRQSIGVQDLTPREIVKQLDLSTLNDEQRAALLSLPDVATGNDEANTMPPIVITINEAKPNGQTIE